MEVLKESYVERFAREQKEKEGIPTETERGIPETEGIPKQKEYPGKEVKEDGKDTRGKGHKAQKD